jgi:hypothetical protein
MFSKLPAGKPWLPPIYAMKWRKQLYQAQDTPRAREWMRQRTSFGEARP